MRWVMALLVLASLAGCLADDGPTDSDLDGLTDDEEQRYGTDPYDADSDDDGVPDPQEESVQQARRAEQGEAQPREFDREESATEASPQIGSLPPWKASKTVTVANSLAGVEELTQILANGPGDVVFMPWSEPRYEIIVTLSARASSEDDARAGVDSMHVIHSDIGYGADVVEILTGLEYDDWRPSPLVPGIHVGGGRSADIEVHISQPGAFKVVAAAGSGDLSLHGVIADNIVATAGSGDLYIEGRAGTVTADAGSGDIELEVATPFLMVKTGSGDISATVDPTADGPIVASAGSGDIELRLATGSDHGYFITASAGSGDVSVDVDDTQSHSSGDNHHVAQTHGFDDRAIQTLVTVSTGSGDIDIEG